ncbi:MAG: S-layer homology domain-containing protein [Clostridia bacterium]|nr:S-layer homology domain-containing protein [Clostridia bacterium]
MKNRCIIAIVLIFTLCIPSLCIASAGFPDADDNIYSDDIAAVCNLGIMTANAEGNFESEAMISRAEFCKILVRLNGFSDGTVSSGTQYFKDVDINHPQFNEIGYCTSRGLLNGYPDGNFYPDTYISYDQVNKIMIDLLGYKYRAEASGGYPFGYRAVASSLGLTDGIDLSFDININRGELCRYINNALDIPLVELVGVGTDGIYEINEDVTILTHYLKMKRFEGFVEANEFYGIYGEIAPEGCIIIDGVIYQLNSSSQASFVGKKVSVVIKIDESKKYSEIHSIIEAESTELILTPAQSPVYKDGKLSYDDNNKQKTVSISPEVRFIYNGEEKVFDESKINNLSSGTVRLVSTNDNRMYDAIIVSEYTSFVVDSKSEYSKTVYDQSKLNKLDFSKDIIYQVTDSSGKAISFEEIVPGSIITYFENESYVEAYISTYTVSGTFTESGTSGEPYAMINDQKISLDDKTATQLGNMGLGSQVKLYVDCFDRAVFAEKIVINTDSIKYMFVLGDTKPNGLSNTVKAKFYDIDNGIEILEFDSKVSVNGDTKKISSASDLNIECPQMVQVKMNEDNKICSITTAKSYEELMTDYGNDGFCEVFAFGDKTFYTDSNSFENKIVFSRSASKFMIVPANMSDYDDRDFKTVTYSFFENGVDYEVAAYNSDKDYEICDVIVCKMSVSQETNPAPTTANNLFVITDISQALNEDGDPCTKLTGYISGTERFCYIDPEDTIVDEDLNARDLEIGDVIFANINSANYLKGFVRFYNQQSGYVQKISYSSLDRPIVIMDTEARRITDSYIYFLDKQGLNPYDYYMIAASGNVTVVEEDGDKTKVSSGTLADIEPGDRLIMHIQYVRLRSVIVFK